MKAWPLASLGNGEWGEHAAPNKAAATKSSLVEGRTREKENWRKRAGKEGIEMAARARARFNEKARGASLGGLLKLEPTPNCIVDDVHYNGTRKWQKTTECFPESCHFGDRMRGCEQRRSSERATLSPPAPRRHLKRLLIAM